LPLGLQVMQALAPPFHQLCGVMSAPILPVMDDVRGQASGARIAAIEWRGVGPCTALAAPGV
jgi:hypothetical protein